MSHTRREALKAKSQALADAWNAKYPVGTLVMAYPWVRPEHPAFDGTSLITRTRSAAWPLGHGDLLVLVEDYSGGISLDHIDVIDETPGDVFGGHHQHCYIREGHHCSCGGTR